MAAAWSKDGKVPGLRLEGHHRPGVWDGKSGKLLRTLGGHGKEVHAVAWSPDGRLATACGDNLVRASSRPTGQAARN